MAVLEDRAGRLEAKRLLVPADRRLGRDPSLAQLHDVLNAGLYAFVANATDFEKKGLDSLYKVALPYLRTHAGEEVPYPKPQAKATFNQTDGDGISWASWSWNPVTGCLHGCNYCYAREIATNPRFATGFPVTSPSFSG